MHSTDKLFVHHGRSEFLKGLFSQLLEIYAQATYCVSQSSAVGETASVSVAYITSMPASGVEWKQASFFVFVSSLSSPLAPAFSVAPGQEVYLG